MEYVIGFVTNYVLICAFIGWFGAQFIKCITYIVKNRSFSFTVLMASGGMPSSHSATVSAMVVALARVEGTNTVAFAIAFIFAFITMYDAAGVRRAAGEQAKVLNKIAKDLSNGDTRYLEKNLKELIGHTPMQVLVGSLLGIAIPFLVPVF